MLDMDLDLESLFAGDVESAVDEPRERFDPFKLLERMDVSTIAGDHALADFRRYVTGTPLVRLHRAPMPGWSFICPDPYCAVWRTEFKTPGEARTAWFMHCDERQHDFTPSWPQDVPFDAPTQPICRPNGFGDNLLIDLIDRGTAVDKAGRPLTHKRCEPCFAAGNGSWANQHNIISGLTCPGQMPCSKCGAGPGEICDRSTRELSPINFGRNNGFCGHAERFDAAEMEDFFRDNGGDLRFPAPWRAEIAPTARRSKPPATGMKVTVRVEADTETNPKWQQVAWRTNRSGRLGWTNSRQVAHVAFPDRRSARQFADEVTTTCDVPASAVTVIDSVAEWQERELFADMVMADARNVMRTATATTPLHHIAWVAGVKTVHASYLRDNNPLVEAIARDNAMSGGAGDGCWYDNTKKGFTVKDHGPDGGSLSVTWAQVVKMIRGKIPAKLIAEINAALDERGSFPTYSREHRRADQWCTDLERQAWMLVRPEDLPPFGSLS